MSGTKAVPTLASLFDGIGGFPLAAVLNGITPLWASEIEKFPMEVTKTRFPDMRHVGDITALNGADLPPVDIITGGSPCQDLSVASGKRAGLQGERSGLFMEQIRVTKELREADRRRKRPAHLVRPRWFVWENVPGSFSSPGGGQTGDDFRIVLEEICRIADSAVSVPRPEAGRWEPAGCILGEKFSLAWRVLDTQYWPGTPQRRRRIYLVADFGGHTAPKILFEQDSLFGDTASGEGTREGVAAATGECPDDTGGTCLTPWDVQSKRIYPENGTWPALYSGEGGSGGRGYVATAFACNQRDEVRDLHDVAAAVCASQQIKQQTLVANTGCLTPWDTQQHRIFDEDAIAPTLAGADGGGGRNPGGLVFSAGFSAGASPTASTIGYQDECAPTLKSGGSGTNMVPSVLCVNDQGGQRIDLSEGVTGTLRSQTGGHQPLVLDADSYCIAGNIIDRQVHNGGNHFGVQEDISYTLSTTDRHAVFSRQRVDVFQKNDVVATQSARQYKDAVDLMVDQAPEHSQPMYPDELKLIRRLSPLEAERLQGYPDFWTLVPGCSDTARYKALGNSVAIPCVVYVLRGIAHFHRLLFAA